ncbi:putative secreted protein with PEP-CTERM sorting signal [Pseudoduganella lurida]|uniref:Putative secreted protein with PEP-CTERM sorting signal n=1 Tax=Pseudoduganella lurida TaxID=1036180 RepID=A0A562R879_9BURK|nr:hypothetical protein [Pseudoduganella lurida]TWI65262.1 putative secreted protein with PEP-CTERM sorting signal [Pseudoduganella lurida]
MTKSYGALSASLLLSLASFCHAAGTGSGTVAQVTALTQEEGAALLYAPDDDGIDAAFGATVSLDMPAQQAGLPRPVQPSYAPVDSPLSPVPEPDIWALLCVGASVLALRGGRDQQRSQKLG